MVQHLNNNGEGNSSPLFMEKREVKIGKVEFKMPTKKQVRIKKKRFVKPKKREL